MSEDPRAIECPDRPPGHPQARLERMYIEEYLKSKNTSLSEISSLPSETAKALMTEACRYASVKLTEQEMRSNVINELHGH